MLPVVPPFIMSSSWLINCLDKAVFGDYLHSQWIIADTEPTGYHSKDFLFINSFSPRISITLLSPHNHFQREVLLRHHRAECTWAQRSKSLGHQWVADELSFELRDSGTKVLALPLHCVQWFFYTSSMLASVPSIQLILILYTPFLHFLTSL